MHIAIDAMGGEGGVNLTVPAALQALQMFPELLLTLVGNEDQIGPLLPRNPQFQTLRLSILHTPDVISETDKPGNVIRNGKNSSMYMAAGLLRRGEAQAMVSAGNTGALIMIGRHLIKTITGIKKPAIVASIPAVMGSILAKSLTASEARVGLLNIGVENHKGTDEVRRAAKILSECSAVNFIGFIEANELFEGVAHVVVCDGFIGNVTIKSSAGVANVVNKLLAEQ